MNLIVIKSKKILKDYYGDRFQGLVLYGSMARKRNDRFSDIDLLVLLKKPFNYFQELRNIISLLYPLQLNSRRLISAKPVDIDEYRGGLIQLYRNVKKEGIAV